MQTNTTPLTIVHDARHALLAHTVERIAQIKAQIAELRLQEDELKQILIDSGEAAIDSPNYRATICDCAGKEKTDWEAIAMRFNPSRQLIRANTQLGERYIQVRVYGRKTSK